MRGVVDRFDFAMQIIKIMKHINIISLHDLYSNTYNSSGESLLINPLWLLIYKRQASLQFQPFWMIMKSLSSQIEMKL